MRAVIPIMLAIAWTLFPALFCRAQSGNTVAEWKAEEQRCIDQCPEFPRFSGTETDQQYKKRLEQEDAYNACQRQCVREYLSRTEGLWRSSYNDGSQDYYERNKDLGPEYPAAP